MQSLDYSLTPANHIRSYFQLSGFAEVVNFTTNHFLHNIVTSILILPTTPRLNDLWHTLKQGGPSWAQYWAGSLSPPASLFLLFNLAVLSLGINLAWKSSKVAGLLPLVAFWAYQLANALARSSGGRYIVPADWVITLYFGIGLLELTTWALCLFGGRETPAPSQENPIPKPTWQETYWIRSTAMILVLFFGIGSLLPISEKFLAPKFSKVSNQELLSKLSNQGVFQDNSINEQEIATFLESPSSIALVGRAFYPRYFPAGQGISSGVLPYSGMDFSRLVFTFIGPEMKISRLQVKNAAGYGVILPGDKPEYFPNAVDVIIIGCTDKPYVDALMVVLMDSSGEVYTRSPASPLACPLSSP
jgi:hypothetical protein